MATKPTRQQDQACDKIARALLDISEAARLDGRSSFGKADFIEVAKMAARASSAFSVDEVAIRALESRVRALGLRSDAVELLTLIDGGVGPVEALLADDEGLRGFRRPGRGRAGGHLMTGTAPRNSPCP